VRLSAQEEGQGELGEPKILSKSTVGATRWLELVKLNWQDDRGRQREWDAVERPFPTEPNAPLMAPQASAVAILPILRINGSLSEVILISQYRPPLGSMCIEAPAGLVGAGEDFTDTAFRELFEETGLRAAAVLDDDDAVLCNDPGITNAACRLLVVEVDADESGNAAALSGIENGDVYGLEEEGESIRLWRLPLKGLRSELNRKVAEGFAVDGKLHCFARGLAMTSLLS
jgi:8-oxo-dGTP pyrophosphatase MutT (NUDIX family)